MMQWSERHIKQWIKFQNRTDLQVMQLRFYYMKLLAIKNLGITTFDIFYSLEKNNNIIYTCLEKLENILKSILFKGFLAEEKWIISVQLVGLRTRAWHFSHMHTISHNLAKHVTQMRQEKHNKCNMAIHIGYTFTCATLNSHVT